MILISWIKGCISLGFGLGDVFYMIIHSLVILFNILLLIVISKKKKEKFIIFVLFVNVLYMIWLLLNFTFFRNNNLPWDGSVFLC